MTHPTNPQPYYRPAAGGSLAPAPAPWPPPAPSAAPRPRVPVVVPLAVLSVALMAGIFWGFALSVMPGLAQVDDATFVQSMQQMNSAIENPLFGALFLGGAVFPAAATITEALAGRRTGALLAASGLLLYLATLAITMAVNIPLNEALAAVHHAHGASAASARAAFEQPWVAAHLVRTVTCTAAAVLLILVPYTGRRPSTHGARSTAPTR